MSGPLTTQVRELLNDLTYVVGIASGYLSELEATPFTVEVAEELQRIEDRWGSARVLSSSEKHGVCREYREA